MSIDAIKLDHMRYFIAAVEARSFAAAGQRLNIAATSVSHGVSIIEQALGRDLLIRKRAAGVVPTPAGEQFLESCRRVMLEVDSLAEEFSDEPNNLSGDLVVGCQEGLTWSIAPRAIEHLSQQHPNLSISVKTIFMDDELKPLEDGEVDLIITFRHAYSQPRMAAKIDSGKVYAKVLCRPQVYAMVHAGHPICNVSKTEAALKDLAPYPHIVIQDGPGLPLIFGMYEAIGLQPNVAMESNVSPGAQSVVGKTQAVSLRVVRPSINLSPLGDELAYLRIPDDILRPDLVAITHITKNGRITNLSKAFIDACQLKFDDGSLKENFFYE